MQLQMRDNVNGSRSTVPEPACHGTEHKAGQLYAEPLVPNSSQLLPAAHHAGPAIGINLAVRTGRCTLSVTDALGAGIGSGAHNCGVAGAHPRVTGFASRSRDAGVAFCANPAGATVTVLQAGLRRNSRAMIEYVMQTK